MKFFKKIVPILFITILFCNNTSTAATLSLDEYLRQVEENHSGLKGSRAISEGAAERALDGQLYLAPTLFSTYNYYLDKRITTTPSFQGTSTTANSYSVGVSKLTDFGLSGKFSYNLVHTSVVNAPQLPLADYFAASPQVDLNFSFFRNGFGSEVKAQQQALESANRAASLGEAFKAKLIRVDAENAYWHLAIARKAVAVQKEILSRAEKILVWAERRVKLQLSDRSDMLQAQAALEVRRLEVKQAENELRSASLAFNSARNISAEEVTENLAPVNPENLSKLDLPAPKEDRLDVQAAEQQQNIATANAQLNKEKAKPNLDLFASYTWNGRDTSMNPSMNQSFNAQHPTTAIGIKFSAPLYFGLASDTFAATAKEKQGAELQYTRKVFEQKQDWQDLTEKLKEAQSRLALTKSIEVIQKDKYETEQDRLHRGRTTAYQTLLFEQDYAQAQLLRIKTQAEVLMIYAKLKMFQKEQGANL